jgi:hypothetical protein
MTDGARLPIDGPFLVLPEDLVAAIESGLWSAGLDVDRLREIFREDPVHPRFYDLATIDAINRAWKGEGREAYIGERSDESPPGDIDPKLSLLIADLGPDQLIALDYRNSMSSPRVVYLTGALRSPWREIAASTTELLSKLTEQ